MAGTISYRFRLRRRLAAAWAALNEILLDSEIGLASDTRELKVGDGATPWSTLPYVEHGLKLERMGDVDAGAKADGLGLVWSAVAGKHVYQAVSPGGGGGGSAIFSGASVKFNADKAVGAAYAKWSWDAAEWDTSSYWSAGAPTRLTVPSDGAGKYLVTITTSPTGASDYDINLFRNGTVVASAYGAGTYQQNMASRVLDLAAGDYLEVGCNNANTQLAARARLQITRLSGYSAIGAPKSPDSYPSTANAMDDEFEGASLDPKWVWRNQGTATAALSKGALRLKGAATNHSPVVRGLQIVEQPISGDFKVQAKLSLYGQASFNNGGLCLVESSTGKCQRFCFGIGFASSGNLYVSVENYSNVTTISSTAYLSGSVLSANPWLASKWLYFQIERVGGTLKFSVSETGEDDSWVLAYSAVQTAFFTTAPDRIGLYVESISATQAVLICDWFRRI